MGNIVVLDELTINKIAAGEVIERPASVIKEMMENSIDAGAKNITVEIRNGGISLIRITDDGSGIAKDDMNMAFERHATSKIRVAEDLENVKSMGFRGEALASIGAIANVEMISRVANSGAGNKLVIEGGKVIEESEIGCPIGTSITVQNLFFNTPVRYKFLKKDYTEAGYIEDIVTRLALINKNIAIKFINNDKVVIQTNGNGDFKTVIYNIYGKDIADGVIDVSYDYEDMHINGVVGKAEIARSNRTNQIFFVNGRYVRDKTLTASAEQAYKGMLPSGKYGFVILNIEMENKKVDINVHPAKLEVRFENENQIFKAIYNSIKSGFEKMEMFKPAQLEEKMEGFNPASLEENKEEKEEKPDTGLFSGIFKKSEDDNMEEDEDIKTNYLESIYNFRKELENLQTVTASSDTRELDSKLVNEKLKEKTQELLTTKLDNSQDTMGVNVREEIARNNSEIVADNKFTEEEKFNIVAEKLMESKVGLDNTQAIDTSKIREAINTETELNEEFKEMYKKTFGVEPVSVRKEKQTLELEKEKINVSKEFTDANMNVFEDKAEVSPVQYKFIGAAFATYIVIEIKDEIYIIDQHAAHERIMYEKIKSNYFDEKSKQGQLLLLPDVITLTHKEMDIAKENSEMFAKAGFEFAEFGENTIKLTSAPSMCENMNTKQLFLEILDEVDTVAVTARKEKEEKFIATIACKASVKANKELDEKEVDELMKKILELENPFTCPHGRPTAIKMSKLDIEKKFNRK